MDTTDNFEVSIAFAPDERGIFRVLPDAIDIAAMREEFEDQKVEILRRQSLETDEALVARLNGMIADGQAQIILYEDRLKQFEASGGVRVEVFECSPYGYMERLTLEEKYRTVDPITGQAFVNSRLLEGKLLSLHMHQRGVRRAEDNGITWTLLSPLDVEKLSKTVAARLWREIEDRSNLSGDAFFRAARRGRG